MSNTGAAGSGLVPMGSANYEKIQAKYAMSKELTQSYRPLNSTNGPTSPSQNPYDQPAAAASGSNHHHLSG